MTDPTKAAERAPEVIQADREAGVPEGMEPWHGGDSAPADWDGEIDGLIFRDGKRYEFNDDGWLPYLTESEQWGHEGDPKDIIAYTPRKEAAPPDVVGREAVDPELIERVGYAVEHPEAKGFALAKAGMTRHDFRRILAALQSPPAAKVEDAGQLRVAVWNVARNRGMNDDAAMLLVRQIADECDALAARGPQS